MTGFVQCFLSGVLRSEELERKRKFRTRACACRTAYYDGAKDVHVFRTYNPSSQVSSLLLGSPPKTLGERAPVRHLIHKLLRSPRNAFLSFEREEYRQEKDTNSA